MNLSLLALPCSRTMLVEVGLLLTLRWLGYWLPTYLASFFPSSREKISQWESNHQPLHSEMDTSPLSSSSLESSQTWKIYKSSAIIFIIIFSHVIRLSKIRCALTSYNFCVSTPILKLEMTFFIICIANRMSQFSVQLNSWDRPWTSKCRTTLPWIDDLKALYDHESILTLKTIDDHHRSGAFSTVLLPCTELKRSQCRGDLWA